MSAADAGRAPPDELLAQALGEHERGNLPAAEALYRRTLEIDPRHPGALHYLGLLLHATGRPDEGVELVERAARIAPGDLACQCNLGNLLRARGRLAEAAAAYRRVLAVDPDHPGARFNLASLLLAGGDAAAAVEHFESALARAPHDAEAEVGLGVALARLGRHSEAARRLEAAVRRHPDHGGAWLQLGTVLRALGRPAEALAAFRRATAIAPDDADAHNGLGLILQARGDLDAARNAFETAARAAPAHAPAWVNLAAIGIEQRDFAAAEAACRRALALRPGHAGTVGNLALALVGLRRLDEARDVLETVLRDAPADATLLCRLGEIRERQGEVDAAIAAYEAALAVDPDLATARYGLGGALQHALRLDAALECYRTVPQLAHEYATARVRIGAILQDQRRIDEAAAAYGSALDWKPEYAQAHSNLLLLDHYRSGFTAAERCAQHRAWARRHVDHLTPGAAPTAYDSDPDRRLRVGYVSPDLRGHPVAYFIEAALAEHDRDAFEIHCYADVARPDHHTARLRDLADHWRDVHGLDDEAVLERIRADRIDVLVDLAGHTADNRLAVFARRAAPIQVTWIGYPDTTGLAAMDYRLVDAWTDPPADRTATATERLVRLETGFLCYRPPPDAPPIGPAPLRERGTVTFGSFNNLSKVSPATVAAWSDILRAVGSSRLLVRSRPLADATTRTRLLDEFAAHGIAAERIEIVAGVLPRSGHLATYARADVALDAFPYNGATTTCEALWMGVPVVTLAGAGHHERVGLSLLARVGLEELVAADSQAYARIAIALAADPGRIETLRAGLRERMARSPVTDGVAGTRALERAYRTMWHDRCARSPTPAADADGALRLHIGGTVRRPGWKILNVEPGPDVDFVGDCRDLSRFADVSVEEVYASHVLEHLGYRDEMPGALAGIRRVLRPGGRLRIAVPDLGTLCQLYLDPAIGLAGRHEIMRMIYGGQIDAHDFHKGGFDFESLARLLGRAGFVDVIRVRGFGLFDDTSDLVVSGRPISLNVEARKPRDW